MSKKSFFIFAAGAIAGWTVSQRVSADAQSWPKASSDATEEDALAPAPSWESRPELPPVRPAVVGRPTAVGGDPFRGAFAGALAEIELHADAEGPADADTQVA